MFYIYISDLLILNDVILASDLLDDSQRFVIILRLELFVLGELVFSSLSSFRVLFELYLFLLEILIELFKLFGAPVKVVREVLRMYNMRSSFHQFSALVEHLDSKNERDRYNDFLKLAGVFCDVGVDSIMALSLNIIYDLLIGVRTGFVLLLVRAWFFQLHLERESSKPFCKITEEVDALLELLDVDVKSANVEMLTTDSVTMIVGLAYIVF